MSDKLNEAYSPEDFRRQGHALIDLLADHLKATTDAATDAQTFPYQHPDAQLEYWQQDFQSPRKDPLVLFEEVIGRSVKLHAPRFMGHQVTPTLPVTILSAAVTAALNQGMAVYEMGMVGNALEKVLTTDLARQLGFGPDASGFITSGGSLGNLTALLTARTAAGDIWNQGQAGRQQLAVMVSEEAHYCIDRAARIMGLGTGGIIKVPVNERFQIRTDLLEQYYQEALAAGKQVFCVVGCAASTSTGSYDDLEAIAAFSQKHRLWFHVDGAHGAPAAFSPTYQHLVKGLGKADSVVVDYHKMMMIPSLSTAVIYQRGADTYKTFAQRAQYLWTEQESEEWYNAGKRSLECTKIMTALNVYTVYRTYGADIFRENVERLYGLGSTFAELVRRHPDFELAYEPMCNIVCFRYHRAGADLDALNQQVRMQLLAEGQFYFVQTVLNGQTYLRVSIMNPLTTENELQELLFKIVAVAGVEVTTG